MRNISRLFVAFFAMLLLLCATAPAIADDALPPIATTQSFALGKDGASRTLWAEFVASKEPRHTWPAYWKDACVQTKIACTADVWKKLPVGFVVTTTRTEAQMQRAIAWAAFGARSAELVAQQKLMRDLNDLIT